jgi:adenosine deaminase
MEPRRENAGAAHRSLISTSMRPSADGYEVLELDEVQHGIAAAESPSVMRFLADHQIRLNICPTSNILLGRVARLQDHPIRKLFDAGVIVTVNSDDAIVFGAGVSEELLSLYQVGVFTAEELDQIRRWGLHYVLRKQFI